MFACALMVEQMTALKKSGLGEALTELHIGVNGDQQDSDLARLFAPEKSQIHVHGKTATTEITTLTVLQKWLAGHEDWYVLYFHMKGVSHPPLDLNWRRGMEHHLIWNWRTCIPYLGSGVQTCGCHWLTPEECGSIVKTPFWGGNFWWATVLYLKSLPRLPEPTWENRYEAESWNGRGPYRPRVKDFKPGWPSAL
jgi:hypothetical protein